MIGETDLKQALQDLEIPAQAPVIAHASLSAFGYVQGGAQSVLRALMACFEAFVMPAFTYKTMITPESGPPNNGLTYGQSRDANRMAELFDPQMAADRLMGAVPELLRTQPEAARSSHPILSFTGFRAEKIIESQTIQAPLQPIEMLKEAHGWVLLLGVGHDVNTSIHYAEYLSGRRQFVRWAATAGRAVECPRFPGCSDGFDAIGSSLDSIARQVRLGSGTIQAVPVEGLITAALSRLEQDPLALLCDRSYCERCEAVRKSVVEA